MSTGPVVALLDTVTFPELMTFLVIALIVLGPDKLPGLARSAGQWVAKLRTMAENLQSEVTGALDESEMQSLKELGEFAVRPRAKLAEYARNMGTETDPDDYTDGDAPASSPPILPPLGVGPDNPMITNGVSAGTGDELGNPTAGAIVPADAIDAEATEAFVVQQPEVSSPPAIASAPPIPARPTSPPAGGVPAHLAGTRLATGGLDDPTPPTVSDDSSMTTADREQSNDES